MFELKMRFGVAKTLDERADDLPPACVWRALSAAISRTFVRCFGLPLVAYCRALMALWSLLADGGGP
jgi:hypothetical protein